jgi:hypothetical protein
VPSVGIEPTSQAPQACVLSIERRGQFFFGFTHVCHCLCSVLGLSITTTRAILLWLHACLPLSLFSAWPKHNNDEGNSSLAKPPHDTATLKLQQSTTKYEKIKDAFWVSYFSTGNPAFFQPVIPPIMSTAFRKPSSCMSDTARLDRPPLWQYTTYCALCSRPFRWSSNFAS